MLDDYTKGVLKANRIREEDVESFDKHTNWVTFKNGVVRRLCETWCRVMGYYAPSTSFNKGKYSEFRTRKYFTKEKSCGTEDK